MTYSEGLLPSSPRFVITRPSIRRRWGLQCSIMLRARIRVAW